MVSNRVVSVDVAFEEDVLRLICSYGWRKFGRKTVFYDELKGDWDMHSAGDLIMCLGDIN